MVLVALPNHRYHETSRFALQCISFFLFFSFTTRNYVQCVGIVLDYLLELFKPKGLDCLVYSLAYFFCVMRAFVGLIADTSTLVVRAIIE